MASGEIDETAMQTVNRALRYALVRLKSNPNLETVNANITRAAQAVRSLQNR